MQGVKTVESSDRTLQAMKWLVELETNPHAESIWFEFDRWFQASAANREEYARVKLTLLRRRTFELSCRSVVEDPEGPRKGKPKNWPLLDRHVLLLLAAALLLVVFCLT
jgi:ferric-dicitrate binding protein FerR (iron transport regulator)